VSLRLHLLAPLLRVFAKRRIAKEIRPVEIRGRFERAARWLFRTPPYTLLRETELGGGLPALVISTRPGSHPPRAGKALLYFHGGGFLVGSPQTHAGMLARLARLARCEVIAPAYRLAPEHPFPAAAEDARAAWDGLIARGYAPGDIVLGGDSAGGNLALGLLADCLARGARPAGLLAFSPVTDLTFSGASIRENAAADMLLPAARQDDLLALYLQGAPADDPRASPLFAEFPVPPPAFLQFSTTEILRDDSLRMAARLRAAGGVVETDAWAGLPHVWVLFDGWIPQARAGLERAAAFLLRCFEADQAGTSAAGRR